jgi:hypothetical protein
MKVDLVRAPIVVGTLVAGALLAIAAFEALASSPRWDDHLINAIGVFAAGLVISFTLRLATGALRPEPGVSRRARLVRMAWLLALALLIFVAIQVAMFIDDMSFL